MNATKHPRKPGFLSRVGMAARFVAFGAFDFSTRGTNPGGGRLRRTPPPERRGEEALALPWERNMGIALVRDLLRNAPQARGLSKTIRVNTVGNLGKLVFRDDGDWQTKAATRMPASAAALSRTKVRSGGARLPAQTGKPRMTWS